MEKIKVFGRFLIVVSVMWFVAFFFMGIYMSVSGREEEDVSALWFGFIPVFLLGVYFAFVMGVLVDMVAGVLHWIWTGR